MDQHTLASVKLLWNNAIVKDVVQKQQQVLLEQGTSILKQFIRYAVVPACLVGWKLLQDVLKFLVGVPGTDFVLKVIGSEYWCVVAKNLVKFSTTESNLVRVAFLAIYRNSLS